MEITFRAINGKYNIVHLPEPVCCRHAVAYLIRIMLKDNFKREKNLSVEMTSPDLHSGRKRTKDSPRTRSFSTVDH
jgi:hypothetical protein